MGPKVVLRKITRPAENLLCLDYAPGPDRNSRSNCASMSFLSQRSHFEKALSISPLVAQQHRSIVHVVHQDVNVTVIVIVPESSTPTDLLYLSVVAPGRGDFLKSFPPNILEELAR